MNNAMFIIIAIAVVGIYIAEPTFLSLPSIVNIINLTAAKLPIALGVGGCIILAGMPQEAAEREIQEELDTQIEVGELFDVVEYDYPDFHLTMYCYLCRVLSGNLTLKEHEAARWLTKETLDQVNWLPADLDLIRKLREEERIWSW